MKKYLLLAVGSLAFGSAVSAFADGFSWHLQLGQAWTSLSNSDNVYDATPGLFNQYVTSNSSDSGPLVGAGLAYQWNYYFTALNVGLSGYYLSSTVSGVKYPLGASSGLDSSNYSANGSSYALMLEPKWIFTQYAWQPYVLGGIGVALNHFQGYSETPNGNDSTLGYPGNASNINFAYEFGAGIQHPLTQNQDAPVLALDYRYLYWGRAGLSTAPGQITSNTVSFGDLASSMVTLSVSWPF